MRARAPRSDRQVRDTRYWELMRSGLTNTEASRILGMHRNTGARIRARHQQQTVPPSRAGAPVGRYLSQRERLQIADLLRLDCSMPAIAAEPGRSPSTIKRDYIYRGSIAVASIWIWLRDPVPDRLRDTP